MIRQMQQKDTQEVKAMMRVFYASEAVHSNGSEEIFQADIDSCLGECPYLEGYVFEENGALQGYAMIARSFATEFGRPCVWIEDLYMKPQFRGQGLGTAFFAFVEDRYPGCVFRLEAEPENTSAVALYKRCGFEELPYMELKK